MISYENILIMNSELSKLPPQRIPAILMLKRI
jgi:hypothetical protein